MQFFNGPWQLKFEATTLKPSNFAKKLTHRETLWECSAERACLRVLEGESSVPVGVASKLVAGEGSEVLTLTGCVTLVLMGKTTFSIH